jgi:protein tyrosine phosphatase
MIFSLPPADNFRPYLNSFQGNTFTDYINAVFVDGYRQARGYMVTEWPQVHTISYLWSLVYDYDVSAVVVLASPEPSPVK